MPRILVTGGAGFIGSNLVDALIARQHEVVVVDDFSSGSRENLADANATERLTIREADIRSPDVRALFDAERPDAVMHLAAQIDVRTSVADPVFDADVNVLGTLNVLEAARACGARRAVVVSSGGCIYGEDPNLPIAETSTHTPIAPYGISKRVLGDYLRFYRDTHGLESAICAFSNVYGPRQDPHGEAGVVAIFLRAMLEGRSTTIFGDGRQTRDFVFVGDAVDSVVRAFDRGQDTYNIGTGIETSVLDLWKVCADATGYEEQPLFAEGRQGELLRNALDASRARRELGWEPKTSLEQGIKETAAFIAARLQDVRQ